VPRARAYVLLGAIDLAYDLENQCVDQIPPGRSKTFAMFNYWLPEYRAFRADRRFQALLARLGLMDYYEKYGPPDMCTLKEGQLTCQ